MISCHTGRAQRKIFKVGSSAFGFVGFGGPQDSALGSFLFSLNGIFSVCQYVNVYDYTNAIQLDLRSKISFVEALCFKIYTYLLAILKS